MRVNLNFKGLCQGCVIPFSENSGTLSKPLCHRNGIKEARIEVVKRQYWWRVRSRLTVLSLFLCFPLELIPFSNTHTQHNTQNLSPSHTFLWFLHYFCLWLFAKPAVPADVFLHHMSTSGSGGAMACLWTEGSFWLWAEPSWYCTVWSRQELSCRSIWTFASAFNPLIRPNWVCENLMILSGLRNFLGMSAAFQHAS